MKACKACGVEKPLDEYYRDSLMRDGHVNRCKDCARARNRENRAKNAEYYRAYDRSRSIFPQRVKLRSERLERLKNDPELRAKANEAQARWKDRNVIKRRCHVVTGNALRDGRLVPRPCERCGHAINVQAHHEDYTKPLEVVWLCPPCHGARHREINEDRWQKVA